MMESEEVGEFFCKTVKGNPDMSVGVAAMETLMEVIKVYQCTTVQELITKMKKSVEVMENSIYPAAAIKSGCELFVRFITLCQLDITSIEECKQYMLERGKLFLEKLSQSRGKIAKFAFMYIKNKSKILVHSKSRVVLEIFRELVRRKVEFEVFVTISQPDNSGEEMLKALQAENIPATLILDSAMGYMMEMIDFVLVGAEAVCESGGIINKIGTYTLAVCAQAMRKPFYVAGESFKFSRVFPLNQKYLPKEYKYTYAMRQGDLKKTHPLVDYTPPEYITALFTDLGILLPPAVSDAIITLYL